MQPPTPAAAPHKPGLVTIVVPAKDEEAAIGGTLRSLPVETLAAAGFRSEVFVLDGRSKDRTADIARAWGAQVLTDRVPGKAAALREARPLFAGDYVVMLDADGTYAPDAIPRMASLLAWDHADVVMGRRIIQEGAMSVTHRYGNRALSLGATMLYGRRCPDLCTGLWGFRRDAFQSLPLTSTGFELEAELFALSARLGYRIAHVRADYMPRPGESKLNGARDGLRIGWTLVRTRFTTLPEVGPAGGNRNPREASA
ncbi:MAG: hypothetical protein QOD77_720 [Thermoplasmata archaeon]|jgi:dolichol-phosphate mannosyltransferase|nr:hypothetical protein [Thermoplasmata archaeon]